MEQADSLARLLSQVPASVLKDDYENVAAIFRAMQLVQNNISDIFTPSKNSSAINGVYSAFMVSGVQLPAGSFVGIDSSGQLVQGVATNVVGYVESACAIGETVAVVFEGLITNSSWSLDTAGMYYLNAAGGFETFFVVTEDFIDGFNVSWSAGVTSVGFAISSTQLLFYPKISSIINDTSI